LTFANSIKNGINNAVTFRKENDNIIVNKSADYGKGISVILNCKIEGRFNKFTINQTFLMETIKYINDKEIVFNLCGFNKPIVIGGDLMLPIKIDKEIDDSYPEERETVEVAS